MTSPIQNPGTSPIQPTQPTNPNQPSVGKGEEGQERPFSIAPEGGEKTATTGPEASRPSPMEVAGDAARSQSQMEPEDLSNQIVKLQEQLGNANTKIQNSNLSPDHFQALQTLAQKMNPDMQTIAKSTGQENFVSPEQGKDGIKGFLNQWLGGAQNTLSGALDYLQNTEKPDLTSYLKLQYAVQRSTQKGELFASIIGSSVSGIKTIMSTQLG